MGSLYQPAPAQEERSHRPLVVAAIFIVVVAAAIWFFARREPPQLAQPGIDPYAENLVITDLHLAQAQNFVGGQVTYLEGTINNVGQRAVTAAAVQTIFRNSLGQIVDEPIQPLRIQQATVQGADFVALSSSPLTPNAAREFRLTFEHISADWNQGMPELRIVKTELK